MVEVWTFAIIAALAVSLFSFIGVVFLSGNKERFRGILSFLISLAVGALFGNVFIHLLPEAFENGSSVNNIAFFTLLGIFIFFILDKFFHWHCHGDKCDRKHLGHKALIADGLHNLVDGIVIGATFMASIPLGIATTVAIALHEIPQEVADFSILIHSGFTRARALLLNFATAIVAVAGTILALSIGPAIVGFTPTMLAITAGMFVYLAGTDLLPELHKKTSTGESIKQTIALILGIALMFLVG